MKRLLGMVATLSLVLACSWTPLYFGTLPGNGETGVSPDTEIRIDIRETDGAIPSLKGAFELLGFSEIDVDIRIEGTEVVLIPRSPLQEGEYHLVGSLVNVHEGASGHYTDGYYGRGGEPGVDTIFTVGGRPTVELHDDERGNPVLVFSEPIQVDTLQGRVLLDGEAIDVIPTDHPRLFGLPLDDLGVEQQLTVTEGVLTRRGASVTSSAVGYVRETCSLGRALGDTRPCW